MLQLHSCGLGTGYGFVGWGRFQYNCIIGMGLGRFEICGFGLGVG